MTISRFTPPVDYLQAASRASLQSFELTRLNHAANLRAEIAALIDQWIQETTEAILARWMLDHHQSLRSSPLSSSDVAKTLGNNLPGSLMDLPDSLFPAPPSSLSEIVPAPPRFAEPRAALKADLPRKIPKQKQSATG